MEKYRQTKTLFTLKIDGKRRKVYSFNGEIEEFRCPKTGTMKNDVSWSHGFTHLKREDGSYAGGCGTGYFEEYAQPVKAKPR